MFNPTTWSEDQWESILQFLKWRREEEALRFYSGEPFDDDFKASYEQWSDEQDAARREEEEQWAEQFWTAKIDVADDAGTPYAESLAASAA